MQLLYTESISSWGTRHTVLAEREAQHLTLRIIWVAQSQEEYVRHEMEVQLPTWSTTGQGEATAERAERRESLFCARAENECEEHYLQIIPIIASKMLLLKMKTPCLREHKNELFTNHQPRLGSRLTNDFGGRREGIRALSIAIMAIQTYWEMAQLRALKHRT